ncbi:hypothetical protein [Paenibacillus sp. DRB1-1]|uniref:hypothetical protein n=1 Tax=Paenibacillus sp. DRB1-1 TaxID=3422309 RepID=UPI003F973D49
MKEQNTPELDLSPIFDGMSNLYEIFSFSFHVLLVMAGAFIAIRIAFALVKMLKYGGFDEGGRGEYQPKPEPEEPVIRTNGGYFVKTPGGEKVFVSDAEIYPNDPDVADRSRVRGKWSSNARSESVSDRSNNDLITGLIIGSAVSNAFESSSNNHSSHSSSHNSYDSHSSHHSYTDHSSDSYGGDSGGGGGGMDF